jgi:isoleucyl-tRNA synthetase
MLPIRSEHSHMDGCSSFGTYDSNANPWDNLKFDLEGMAEARNKFFRNAHNTYSFRLLYEFGFDYSETGIPLEKQNRRWSLDIV